MSSYHYSLIWGENQTNEKVQSLKGGNGRVHFQLQNVQHPSQLVRLRNSLIFVAILFLIIMQAFTIIKQDYNYDKAASSMHTLIIQPVCEAASIRLPHSHIKTNHFTGR